MNKWEASHASVKTGGSDEWETPPALFALLNEEFSFHTDAAATYENSLCEFLYSPETDSLKRSWRSPRPWCGMRHTVWLNPPYSQCRDFMAKARVESTHSTIVCLVPARTDTRWWHESVHPGASEVRLIKGRLKYRMNGEERSPAPFPSCIVVYRPGHTGPPIYATMERP